MRFRCSAEYRYQKVQSDSNLHAAIHLIGVFCSTSALSKIGNVHGGSSTTVPLAIQRPLDLGGELQQESVIRLSCQRMNAKRQTILLDRHWQRDTRDATEIGQRSICIETPEFREPLVRRVALVERDEIECAQLVRGKRHDRRQQHIPLRKQFGKAARDLVEDDLHLLTRGFLPASQIFTFMGSIHSVEGRA